MINYSPHTSADQSAEKVKTTKKDKIPFLIPDKEFNCKKIVAKTATICVKPKLF